MIQTLGLLVVLLSVIAVVVFMFRSLMPATAGAPTGGGVFAGFGDTGSLSGFGGGLVAAVAAATTLNSTSAGVGGAASVGATLGLAYFLLSALGLTAGIRIVSGMVGTAGFIALVVFLLTGTGCALVPLWQRLLILGLILFWGVLGVVGALVFTGLGAVFKFAGTTLAFFGALKIAVFLSAPLGISLIDLPIKAWVVAAVAAALLGALSAIRPSFVIGLAAAVIGAASLGVGVVVGDACSTGPDFSDLSALTGFAIVYLLLKFTIGRFLRR